MKLPVAVLFYYAHRILLISVNSRKKSSLDFFIRVKQNWPAFPLVYLKHDPSSSELARLLFSCRCSNDLLAMPYVFGNQKFYQVSLGSQTLIEGCDTVMVSASCASRVLSQNQRRSLVGKELIALACPSECMLKSPVRGKYDRSGCLEGLLKANLLMRRFCLH